MATFDGSVAVAVAVAEGVVEALALALALALAVDADAEAVSEGVADVDALADAVESPRSPRTTGAPASAALPPHPARSMTAHAMAAPTALLFVERGLDAPKRLLRALIVGRASPGLCPIIVHVFATIGHGGSAHYRVNTVHFKKFCPGLRWFVIFQAVGACSQGRSTPCTRHAARHAPLN